MIKKNIYREQLNFLSIQSIIKRLILVLHRAWKNRASSGLKHARKWKFELEHARALENSTWSSFCPGIWLKMHYFCQNLPIFKGSFASSIKKSSIENWLRTGIFWARACLGATLVLSIWWIQIEYYPSYKDKEGSSRSAIRTHGLLIVQWCWTRNAFTRTRFLPLGVIKFS